MNKLMTILGAFMFAAVVLTSCGSPEADAKKMQECACDYLKLVGEAVTNPEEADEKALEALEEKCDKLAEKMKEKYKDEESDDTKAFNKAAEDFNPSDCK